MFALWLRFCFVRMAFKGGGEALDAFPGLAVSRSYCDDCSSVFVVYSGGEAEQEVPSKLQQ